MKAERILSIFLVLSSVSMVQCRSVRASRYVERQRNVQFVNDLMHLKGSTKKDSTKTTTRGKGDSTSTESKGGKGETTLPPIPPTESKKSSGGKGENTLPPSSKSSTSKKSKKGKGETVTPTVPPSSKSSSGKGKGSKKTSKPVSPTVPPSSKSSSGKGSKKTSKSSTPVPAPSPVVSPTDFIPTPVVSPIQIPAPSPIVSPTVPVPSPVTSPIPVPAPSPIVSPTVPVPSPVTSPIPVPAPSPIVSPTVPVPTPVAPPNPAPSPVVSPVSEAPQAAITTVPTTSEAPTFGATTIAPTSTSAPSPLASDTPSLAPTSSPAPTPQASEAPSLAPSSSAAPTPGESFAPVSEAPVMMSFSSGPTIVSTSEFDTTLGLDQVPDRFQSSFVDAARIWDTVIVGDMPELVVDSTVLNSPNLQCDPSTLPAVIDDIFICASVKPIDGPQGILGSAGPNLARFGATITVTVGSMNFDEADMDMQLAAGSLEGLILHEMAHVYGFGTLWALNNLAPQTLPCPYSYNSRASEQYRLISGCDAAIPVEADFGAGTQCLHWDEDCFLGELMTGVSTDGLELSVLTVAALDDLGYTVDYSRADPFDTSKMSPTCVCKRRQLRGNTIGDDVPAAFSYQNVAKLPLTDFSKPSNLRPPLSEEGHRIARAHGMAILEANHQWKNAYLRDDQAELYIGDQIIVVLYMENGFKYTVMVTR